MLLERRAHEVHIGVEARRRRAICDIDEALRLDRERDGVPMHAELGGDGAQTFAELSDAEVAVVMARATEVSTRPGRPIFGKRRDPQILLVTKGVVREYYECADGRDVTRLFARAGDFVANAFDETSSHVNIAGVTDAHLLAMRWTDVETLSRALPQVTKLVRTCIQASQRGVLEREFRFATLSPADHYEYLTRHSPWIEQNAPLYVIASFLRIFPEQRRGAPR